MNQMALRTTSNYCFAQWWSACSSSSKYCVLSDGLLTGKMMMFSVNCFHVYDSYQKYFKAYHVRLCYVFLVTCSNNLFAWFVRLLVCLKVCVLRFYFL